MDTKNGVVRAHDVMRVPEGQRWDEGTVRATRGTPQRSDPTKPGLAIPTRTAAEDEARLHRPDVSEVAEAGLR